MEIFQTDANGQPREQRKLLGRRNYAAIVAYDPEVVNATYGRAETGREGSGKLSLAVDFMAQGDGVGGFANVVKYGPVVVPALGYAK